MLYRQIISHPVLSWVGKLLWQDGTPCPFITLDSPCSHTGMKGLFKHKNLSEFCHGLLSVLERN